MNIEELVVRHAGWIRLKARKYYSNEIDADDLAGETIYKCLSSGSRYDKSRSFKPWVITIMENTFKTQYNRRKCVRFFYFDDYQEYLDKGMTDQRVSVRRILSIMRSLARKSCCIEAVLLYAKGYEYQEIADNIGIPIGTVKSRIAAGRRILREALETDLP